MPLEPKDPQPVPNPRRGKLDRPGDRLGQSPAVDTSRRRRPGEAARQSGDPCPLILDLDELINHQRGLLGAMHRLRKDLLHCRSCPQQDCPARQSFNARVDQAIQEISDEYHLVELYGEGESDD